MSDTSLSPILIPYCICHCSIWTFPSTIWRDMMDVFIYFFNPFQCIKFTELFFEQDMHTHLPTYMISEKIKKCALHLKQKSLQTSLFLAEVLCSSPQWQIHTAESFVLLKEIKLSPSLSILINYFTV